MINRVTDLTKKSFINYSGPDSGSEFKNKNIVFGYNGRGKTSLALGVVDEFLKSGTKTIENYRLFNRKYVTESLLLKEGDSSKIKGVIANFSKQDVDAEKNIEELEKQIKDTKPLFDEISLLRINTRKEIDNIHDNRKGTAKIQKKPEEKTVEEIIKFYKDDVIEAKKVEKSEEELLKIRGDNTFEAKKQRISSLDIGIISNIDADEISEIAIQFNKTFSDEIPTAQIIEWLNNGLEIHQDGDNCKFCGGTLNYQEIKTRVELYNANERQKAIRKLVGFKKKLDEIANQIKILEDKKDNIIANLSDSKNIPNCFEEIQQNKGVIINQITAIQNKIGDTSVTSGFNSSALEEALNLIREKRNIISKSKSDEITALDKKINSQAILVKGAIGVEISKNTLINDNLKVISEKELKLDKIKKENAEYYNKINNFKNSKSTTKDFADHINIILKDIGVGLRLDLFEDDYVIKHETSSDILTVEDISEGEQNLLSLLFFYYELFTDKEQKDYKEFIEIIIIDDPISSVDDINKMYVLELIRNLLDLDTPQVFVLTHVWEDFCNLCYGKQDKEATESNPATPYRFLEIKKDEHGSKVVKTKTNETPYRHHFNEIYEFSKNSNCNDLSDCEIYHYPNVMRKVLEEFLSFKVKKNSPTRDNKNNIEKVLLEEDTTDNNKTKVSALLDICNLLSHKASRNPDEILKAAKFLMSRIKVVDNQHFNSMVGE